MWIDCFYIVLGIKDRFVIKLILGGLSGTENPPDIWEVFGYQFQISGDFS